MGVLPGENQDFFLALVRRPASLKISFLPNITLRLANPARTFYMLQ